MRTSLSAYNSRIENIMLEAGFMTLNQSKLLLSVMWSGRIQGPRFRISLMVFLFSWYCRDFSMLLSSIIRVLTLFCRLIRIQRNCKIEVISTRISLSRKWKRSEILDSRRGEYKDGCLLSETSVNVYRITSRNKIHSSSGRNKLYVWWLWWNLTFVSESKIVVALLWLVIGSDCMLLWTR